MTSFALVGLALLIGWGASPRSSTRRGQWPPSQATVCRHAALPRRVCTLSEGVGARSVRRLQGTAVVAAALGAVALLGPVTGTAVATLLAPVAVVTVARLTARPAHPRPDPGLALLLDLAAAALRAGQPVAAALELAAPASQEGPRAIFGQVAGLLRLGTDPAEAWELAAADARLAPVARAAARSASSGARLALGWEQLAGELRAEQRASAEARAQRAGVWAMAPLGLCFLPAFVCLGVVPIVVGIASAAFGGVLH